MRWHGAYGSWSSRAAAMVRWPVAWNASASESVSAVVVPVVDTVGADDIFQAALLTWLAEHDCLSPQACASMRAPLLREALQFAACAASITCSRRGADLPRRSELERLSAPGVPDAAST